jgi:mono/diheme cytochrome c family protein
VVETQEEFEQWLADWQAGAPVETVTQAQALNAEPPAGADTPDASEASAPSPGSLAMVKEAQEMEMARNLFLANCSACHAIQGVSEAGQIAPNLTLLGRRNTIAAGMLENNVENLVRWISDPQSIKPGALMPGLEYAGGRAPVVWPAFNLTPEQVRMVAQYLYNLR